VARYALDEAIIVIIPKSLQVASLLVAPTVSWCPFVTIQSNTPNQIFVELLGKIFKVSTMRQTSNNHFSKCIVVFVGNKGNLKGNKNQIFHNVIVGRDDIFGLLKMGESL
jgi:hypothetical protein